MNLSKSEKTAQVGLDKGMDPLYKGPMSTARRQQLEARRDALLARLRALPNLMRGSVYARQHTCGRATCPCARGGPKHPTRQLTVTLRGRTHTRYVRQAERAQVEALLAAYHELWALVEALTAVNLALLRGRHPGGRTGRRPSR